jgi:hypothetical protein
MDVLIHFAVSFGVAGIMAYLWLRFCTHHGI